MKSFNALVSALALLICGSSCSQNMDDVVIESIPMSENVYMLTGAGGNIGVSVGDDGVFVIDDQFARISPKIIAAIKKLSTQPIQFLVNTHHHGDHTGGNENMAKEGAVIMAHDNVRKRLEGSSDDKDSKSNAGLPVLTFNDKLNVFINGEQVAIFHVENAHTDGDAIIYFTESNVLHTGDTYFNGRYPYIDLSSGGSVDGYIEAVEHTLMLIDDATKIIPGHGSASNKKEYAFFLKMLKDLKNIVQEEIAKGKSEEEVTNNTALTKTYDDLGYSWNFISSEKIRKAFYKSLKKK